MNQLIKSDLLSDENIIWSGQPDSSKVFSNSDIFLIPFSIMWGGFAVFWETTVLLSDAPLLFVLWGIPFVLIGLYIMIGRFFYKVYLSRNTYYYITNKRILILRDTNRRKVEAADINSLPSINLNVNSNGSGTIVFGYTAGFLGMYANSGMDFFIRGNRHGIIAPAFYDLEQANKVYRLVSELRNGTY